MRIQVIASGSSGNCYLIDDGASKLLLDAGIPVREIRRHVQPTTLDAVLVTHRHKDHCKAVKDLCKVGVPVFALPDVLQAEGVDHHPCAHPVAPSIREDGTIIKTYWVGGYGIIPFRAEHDVPNVGYIVQSLYTGESLLYFTDTMYVRYRFPPLDYMLVEANYCEDVLTDNVAEGIINADLAKRVRKTHMSLESLLAMLQANDLSKLKQIYLLHLSDNNSDERRIKTEVQKITGSEVYVA